MLSLPKPPPSPLGFFFLHWAQACWTGLKLIVTWVVRELWIFCTWLVKGWRGYNLTNHTFPSCCKYCVAINQLLLTYTNSWLSKARARVDGWKKTNTYKINMMYLRNDFAALYSMYKCKPVVSRSSWAKECSPRKWLMSSQWAQDISLLLFHLQW